MRMARGEEKACPTTSICPEPAMAAPLTCKDPHAAADADAVRCECAHKFFAAALPGSAASTADVTCRECPKGVVCDVAGNAWGNLTLEPGYWQQPDWLADAAALVSSGVEKCKVGRWTAEQVDVDPLCRGGANWTTCRDGHTGVKCQVRCHKSMGCDRTAVVLEL